MESQVATANIAKITKQLYTLFQNIRKYINSHGYKNPFGKLEILDNNDWWEDFSFPDFLAKVAKHMRLGPMIARERFPIWSWLELISQC
jgi:tyrosyl-tRNA synthetase